MTADGRRQENIFETKNSDVRHHPAFGAGALLKPPTTDAISQLAEWPAGFGHEALAGGFFIFQMRRLDGAM
jgi:hypothetical protein